jgi:hypothetical protein
MAKQEKKKKLARGVTSNPAPSPVTPTLYTTRVDHFDHNQNKMTVFVTRRQNFKTTKILFFQRHQCIDRL